MTITVNPSRGKMAALCSRPSERDPKVVEIVSGIIDRVRQDGDEAIRQIEASLAGSFDWPLKVSEAEVNEAENLLPEELKAAIRKAAANIEVFHKAQLPHEISVETAPGVRCIQRPVPIRRVGLYIPGGTAPLFSTVLMLAIPARVAGCPEVVLCTPCGRDGKVNPAVLWAASYCGIRNIFRIGGAQAIAAMALGTGSIPRVDKIFGPGNRFVTTAKQMLGGSEVSIDMPAGPSEVMVMVDEDSDDAFAAADLLSQAEHGRDSQVMLVGPSEAKLQSIAAEVDKQVKQLSREELAEGALASSRFVAFDSPDDAIDFANLYAPEHLIISTKAPWKIADRITAAGSVFIGSYTPESAGDYASGTNHTLPTCSWARSCSGVNIDSYMRKMTLQEITQQGLDGLADTIIQMADAEGLQAHANAVKVRLGK